ncbi:WD repeat domain-containing protein 83 [Lingula anatina]|uniref:WD repeat domain-containing protein 83 n=1 Tax=Lingula anatina TaxID=7574 RepID=A0A1S3IGP9_LINAN|nr:WD repeat domain-containing protein 83 [Lingula anatina]|eukprot:XP_013396649.1 WD repeat domain-containing protein 83 [Lingula anatina]
MGDDSKAVVERLVGTIDCKQGAVRAVRFNVDGNYCLTCGSDKSIKLWNPHKKALIKVYSGHGYEVLDAQASCDSSQMCSCGTDKAVYLWDVARGVTVRKYRGHPGSVNCVRFNEESTVIMSGSIDGTVRIWDCKSRKMEPIQILDEAKDSVTSVAVSDHEILTGSADGRVRRYDLRMGDMHSDFIGQTVTCVNFSRDGQCTLSSSLDNTLRLLDKATGELLNEYVGHKNVQYKIDSCLSSSDTHILSGSEDGKVYVWDLVEGKLLKTLDHGTKTVHSLSYHPSESCLLTAMEGKVYVWKSKYGQIIDPGD